MSVDEEALEKATEELWNKTGEIIEEMLGPVENRPPKDPRKPDIDHLLREALKLSLRPHFEKEDMPIAPASPHPLAKSTVTLTVTQEELAVIKFGLEEMADKEDGEYRYISQVAAHTQLPPTPVTYAHLAMR